MRIPICHYCGIYCGNSWRVHKNRQLYKKMNSRWKISVKYNFVLTCKLNTFQIEFLFTSQDTQRKSWSTSIWIKLILWLLQWLIGRLMLRRTIFTLKKSIKKFMVLKYHIFVQLILWCILQIALDQIHS